MREFQIRHWRVRPSLNTLSGSGGEVRLEPKVMEVLCRLAAQAGQVVSKEELIEQVWEGRAVGDEVIANAVWELRKTLGDNARRPSYIQTIPKRGYRLIAPVLHTAAEVSLPSGKSDGRRTWHALAAGAVLLMLVWVWKDGFDQKALNLDGGPAESDAVAEYSGPVGKRVPPQVREACLMGRFFWKKRTREGLEKALGYFEEAVRLDPDYAPAYAGLADTYIILADHRHRPSFKTLVQARQAASTALQLDPGSAEAHTAMGWVRWVLEWDWEGAEQSFLRALELRPDYATGHQWYGSLLEGWARLDEAQVQYRIAQQLDPLSPIMHTTAAHLALRRHDWETARRSCQKALEVAPDFALAHLGLIKISMEQQAWQEAEYHYDRLRRISSRQDLYFYLLEPEDFEESMRHKQFVMSEDRYREAQRKLEQLALFRHVPPIFRAEVDAMANRPDRAVQWLEREFEARSREIFTLQLNPMLKRLHGNPGFQNLLSRVPRPPHAAP